ncbi:LuxR C-terminal-related transcriptional regulator [Tabrizicola sp.]|jgi:PAS domain S-box-containing protein|uniref:LuxR family transcriptional regulator n=1 Tax=Tabrizicola sp. TaxID=2005166 RepID=UPI0025DEFF32|nr:LuxR C-terminal-related transcriptional regulator [Tabrizicola sp.]MBY0349407.1 LuxR C-terminal-related transcriptional regulator [Tabrizicola sp.]MDK2773750.1 LuxR C-terminal-related transcriptional regulator [Tabrizicola sp.]
MRDYERLAFQHGPDATLILAHRVILRASLRVEAVFGWTPRELEGQSIRMLYPTETDYELIGERARKAMQASTVYRDERFMRRKDGQVIWTEGKGTGLDAQDPQRLAVWTYRPLEAETEAEGPLTPTEKRIARYLVNGFTSKEIALALGSSPRTVEVHRANMIAKTGVRNSFELVRRLLSAGAG